jgi:hypothetical protein
METESAAPQALSKDERMWGMLCHLSALSVYLGIPFGNLVGPLVVWLMKKDEYAFVEESGKESLNFQIAMTIYVVLTIPLLFILIGFVLLVPLLIAHLVLVIVASIKSNEGVPYRYPFIFRLIK